MSRRSPDGESRLVFVPEGGLDDPLNPTDDELNDAGVIDITPFAIEWDFPESGNTIDIADMSSKFNKTAAGTFGGDTGSVTAFRDSVTDDDDAWAALPRGTRGFFVERLFGGDDTAFAAAQKVDIYQGEVISRAMQGRQRNNAYRFTVQFSIEEEPLHDITVDAS